MGRRWRLASTAPAVAVRTLAAMTPRKLRAAAAIAVLVGAALINSGAASAATGLKDVLLVGNSQAGTVSFIDGHTFASLGSINVIPDKQQRIDAMNPVDRAGYELVKQQEGGDRFVDDMFVSPDGRTLYVSRGNLDDVVAVDLA